MPDFNLNQWLTDNGYDAPDDLSLQADDYWGGQYDQINPIATIDNFWNSDSADPVMAHMYWWASNNPAADFSSEEDYNNAFASQLFMTLFNSASVEAQEEFVSFWNAQDDSPNIYFNPPTDEWHEDYGGFNENDVAAAASWWGQEYGADLDGIELFSGDSLVFPMEELVEQMTGSSSPIHDYIDAYGYEAWQNLVASEEIQADAYNLDAQTITDRYLSDIANFRDQSDQLKDAYEATVESDLATNQARGLSFAGRRGFGSGMSLKGLNAQFDALETGVATSTEVTNAEQSLLQEQWDTYMESIFDGFNAEAESNFNQLLNQLNQFVQDYNLDVADVFTNEQESDIYNLLAQMAGFEGMMPPMGGTGWTNLGDAWEGMGGCVDPTSGNFGVICPSDSMNAGQCVPNSAACDSDLSGSGGGGGPDTQEEFCNDPNNFGHPDCITDDWEWWETEDPYWNNPDHQWTTHPWNHGIAGPGGEPGCQGLECFQQNADWCNSQGMEACPLNSDYPFACIPPGGNVDGNHCMKPEPYDYEDLSDPPDPNEAQNEMDFIGPYDIDIYDDSDWALNDDYIDGWS
jgi:hypothetical protein